MVNITTSSEQKYLLGRGGLSSNRLTLQHFVITERQGWLLHPDIESHISGKDDIKIADLATGNGVWVNSLSKLYPNAELVGLDISDAQFPPAFTRPKNVTFGPYNLFDPVPQQYQDCFDVINIRLIVAAIYNTDTDIILDHLMTMLKPGGCIQWADLTAAGCVAVNESLEVDSSLSSYVRRIDALTGWKSALDFADNIPEAFKRKGFVQVQHIRPPLNLALLHFESELTVWSFHELFKQVSNSPKEGAKLEMEKAAQEMQDDVASGKLLAYNWAVAIGQKPASS